MWKITSIASRGKDEYDYAKVPGHPKADVYNFVLLHRIIMENYIGRALKDDEVVHHKNGNKKDNDINNLQLLKISDHNAIHSRLKKTNTLKLKCPSCGTIFFKPKRNTHLVKGGEYSSCSRKCRSKFSRDIQLNGMTKNNIEKINSNVIEEFFQQNKTPYAGFGDGGSETVCKTVPTG